MEERGEKERESEREIVTHVLVYMIVQEKDAELASLKAKLLSSSPDKAELESRLRELTESLIQKQTTLETLNSERNSLNLQMQRMQVL